MDRIVFVAKLKPGSDNAAADIVHSGPPYDPSEIGLARLASTLAAQRSSSYSKAQTWSGSFETSSTTRWARPPLRYGRRSSKERPL